MGGVKIGANGVKTPAQHPSVPSDYWAGYRKICAKCKSVMRDLEQGYGDWVHPNTGKCPHDGKKVRKNSRWAKRYHRKRDRRAHNRITKAMR